MQTIDNILSAYNLNESEVQRIANEAKASSTGCGMRKPNPGGRGMIEVSKTLLSDTWTLLDKISDEVWYSEMEVADKISLGFQLYEMFPSYYHFLVPFYHGIRNREIYLVEHKEAIWKRFIQYLLAEPCYADPVSYVLWVEFFEDVTTVKETWQGLVSNCPNKKLLLTLLEFAGPVPFSLKEIHYEELISDRYNHEYILKSLMHSAYDVYGKLDEDKVRSILIKLEVDKESENYRLLMNKLN